MMAANKLNKFGDEASEPEFMEYQLHKGPIKNIEMSADGKSVISAAHDGTIIVQNLKEMCNGYDMGLSLQLLSGAATQSVEIANRKKKQ